MLPMVGPLATQWMEKLMKDTQILERIQKRLNILIALQLAHLDPASVVPTATRIRGLADLGLPPSEIAEIFNKSVNYVTATLSKRKARKRGKKL